jgi:hypothetical protein
MKEEIDKIEVEDFLKMYMKKIPKTLSSKVLTFIWASLTL